MVEDFRIYKDNCEYMNNRLHEFGKASKDRANRTRIYSMNVPDREIMVLFEAEYIEIPFVNLVTLILETELYQHWFPFCKSSHCVQEAHPCKLIGTAEFFLPFPFANRSGNFYGFAINRLKEEGTITLMSSSTDYNFEKREYQKEFFGYKNLDLNGMVSAINHNYAFEIKPISREAFSLRIILCADFQLPQAPIGLKQTMTRAFMYYIMKKMIRIGRDFKGTVYEKSQVETMKKPLFKKIMEEIELHNQREGW